MITTPFHEANDDSRRDDSDNERDEQAFLQRAKGITKTRWQDASLRLLGLGKLVLPGAYLVSVRVTAGKWPLPLRAALVIVCRSRSTSGLVPGCLRSIN